MLRRRSAMSLVAALVALVCAATLAAPPAQAHRVKWRTTASFGLTASHEEGAVGWVSSRKKACVNNRKVKLFMKRKHRRNKLVGVDRRTGRPTGSGDGYYLIRANLRVGKRYYIKVVRKNIGNRRHKHICKAYRSRAFRWS